MGREGDRRERGPKRPNWTKDRGVLLEKRDVFVVSELIAATQRNTTSPKRRERM